MKKQLEIDRVAIFTRGPAWLQANIRDAARFTGRSMNDLILDALIERFGPKNLLLLHSPPTKDSTRATPRLSETPAEIEAKTCDS